MKWDGTEYPRSGGEGENAPFAYKVSKKSGTMVTTKTLANTVSNFSQFETR